jgi:hypothetical protein
MIDIWTLSLFLDDIAPSFELVDGWIYVDRNKVGLEALSQKIGEYTEAGQARYWVNMVPIDDLLEGASGEWSISDPAVLKIVDVYRRSWVALIQARWGVVEGLSVESLHDEETGDLIVALRQKAPVGMTAR